MTDQERSLQTKTTIILGKDTSKMTLNDIIEGLVNVIQTETKITNDPDSEQCILKEQ